MVLKPFFHWQKGRLKCALRFNTRYKIAEDCSTSGQLHCIPHPQNSNQNVESNNTVLCEDVSGFSDRKLFFPPACLLDVCWFYGSWQRDTIMFLGWVRSLQPLKILKILFQFPLTVIAWCFIVSTVSCWEIWLNDSDLLAHSISIKTMSGQKHETHDLCFSFSVMLTFMEYYMVEKSQKKTSPLIHK